MSRLEPPHTHSVKAAVGWLELGLPEEALTELAGLPADLQEHADVLELRWESLARQQRWDPALEVATILLRNAPDRPSAWLHHAYALRRSSGGGLSEAWTALLPAAERFPNEMLIAFNLSCYACQMNRLDDARAWLCRALEVGPRERIKQMALQDKDLQPLWNEIQEG